MTFMWMFCYWKKHYKKIWRNRKSEKLVKNKDDQLVVKNLKGDVLGDVGVDETPITNFDDEKLKTHWKKCVWKNSEWV